MEEDDRRYAGLKTSMVDSLFAAYDPLDKGCQIPDSEQFRLSLYASFSFLARRDFLDIA